jgi:hypothetical protein
MRSVERALEIHLIMQYGTTPRGRNTFHGEMEYNGIVKKQQYISTRVSAKKIIL